MRAWEECLTVDSQVLSSWKVMGLLSHTWILALTTCSTFLHLIFLGWLIVKDIHPKKHSMNKHIAPKLWALQNWATWAFFGEKGTHYLYILMPHLQWNNGRQKPLLSQKDYSHSAESFAGNYYVFSVTLIAKRISSSSAAKNCGEQAAMNSCKPFLWSCLSVLMPRDYKMMLYRFSLSLLHFSRCSEFFFFSPWRAIEISVKELRTCCFHPCFFHVGGEPTPTIPR